MTALVLTAPARAADPSEKWLFVTQAATARTVPTNSETGAERFRLVLPQPAPVTKFADRPFRDAHLVSPAALAAHWQTWFADSPPNAVVTYAQGEGKAPTSIVVELTKPTWNPRTREIGFTATREPMHHDPAVVGPNWTRPDTPRTMTDVSVFIDSAEDCDLSAQPVSCFGAILGGARLAGAHLAGADLAKASMSGSDLSGADLSGADLSGADLSRSNLSGADLSGAKMNYVDLTGTDLTGANLTNASLPGAEMLGVKLAHANLTGANLNYAGIYGRGGTDETTTCPSGQPGPCW